MTSRRKPSGRFVLRLPPALHGALQAAARAAGLSLNEDRVRRLASAGPGLAGGDAAASLVTRAAALAGDGLVAVIVYGSWARGEAAPTSDVDVLVVVEPRVALTRALYRAWDERPVTWQGRAVDPHFAHPPDERAGTGLWAEIAIDGVVLFERGVQVSRHLARVRRAIAGGAIVRRLAHGQPYWTEVA